VCFIELQPFNFDDEVYFSVDGLWDDVSRR